jgi:hypothetical protein
MYKQFSEKQETVCTFCHSGRGAGISYNWYFLNGDPGISRSLFRVYHGTTTGMTCKHKRSNCFVICSNRQEEGVYDLELFPQLKQSQGIGSSYARYGYFMKKVSQLNLVINEIDEIFSSYSIDARDTVLFLDGDSNGFNTV